MPLTVTNCDKDARTLEYQSHSPMASAAQAEPVSHHNDIKNQLSFDCDSQPNQQKKPKTKHLLSLTSLEPVLPF